MTSVEDNLKEMYGNNVRVYNFSAVSAITVQELATVVIDVSNFEPDIIVSYGAGNNIMNPNPPGVPHRFIFYELNPLWETDVSRYPAMHMFFFGSQLFRLLFRDYFEDFFTGRAPKRSFAEPSIPFYVSSPIHYAESLIKMKKVSNAFGAQFYAFIQPLRSYYHESPSEKARLDRWINIAEEYLRNSREDVEYKNLMADFADFPESQWKDNIHVFSALRHAITRTVALELKSKIVGLKKKSD